VYFGPVNGVIRTRVGYCGGKDDSPTYANLRDHSESIQLEFDPAVVSYAQLLDLFWGHINHGYNTSKPQYRNAVLYHSEAQKLVAEEKKKKHEEETGEKVKTDIREVGPFYYAEDYHQKYELRQNDELMAAFDGMHFIQFADSRAAAKLNGYVGGACKAKDVLDELPQCSELSDDAKKIIEKALSKSKFKLF